jgi:hypothetical protein
MTIDLRNHKRFAARKQTRPLAVATSIVPVFGLGKIRFTRTRALIFYTGNSALASKKIETSVEIADPEAICRNQQ